MNAVAVSSILKEGIIISSRLTPGNAWHHNIVCKCENNVVDILLLDSYVQNIIALGSGILLKHANEFFEYLFEGTVSSIHAGHPGFITIQVNKAEELINTRMFPRYDINLAADIRPLWGEEKYFSVLTNISLGGMAFVSKHEFEYGEECEITIYLPDNQTVRAKGKIIRRIIKGDILDYSMQFTEMLEEDNNLLSDYIAKLEDQWARMRADFTKMSENSYTRD